MQLPLCWPELFFYHTLFSTSRPPSADPAAKLRCANVNLYLHYNTIVQCRSGYVVSLATPTKAEPLYKVHTHAGPCSQFYDRGCPHLEVILEFFFLLIIFSFIECLYQRFTVNKNNNNNNINFNSSSSSSEVYCKQE